MAEIVAYNMDDVFHAILRRLTQNPQFVSSPRGQKIKEELALTFRLQRPRSRVVSNPLRATNHGFAVGEFLWYWQGKQDLETMLFYNKRMKDFSDDGKTLNSAYGRRLKVDGSDEFLGDHMSQWRVAIRELVRDPDSRRAVLHINRPEDARKADVDGSKDVPCTLSLQFFIREKQLHLHTVMRSNDVFWGLTYDAFSFTLLQECMLLELKEWEKFKELQLGEYIHTAGSMHVYERHFEVADKIASIAPLPVEKMVNMEPITSLEDLQRLCSCEQNLRARIPIEIEKFTGGLKWMAEQLNEHLQKRNRESDGFGV